MVETFNFCVFLWFEVTFKIFKLSEKIPVVKCILKMLHKRSAIGSLVNIKIFKRMLLFPVVLMLSNLILPLELFYWCKEILEMNLYRI